MQGTGSGKLTVPKTVCVVMCGVTLVIKNTLSIGADQQAKFTNRNQQHDAVRSFQLDSLNDEAGVKKNRSFLAN